MTNTRRLVFPALVAAGILWGTTVPLSKVALAWLPPAWLAFGRFGLAAAVLVIASRSRLRGACSPAILVSGAAGYGGSVLLQNLGIERTSVTHAALLIGATPVLVAILAAVLGHSVARPMAWAGFGLSLGGVGFITAGHGSGSSMAGDGLVLLAQLASAGFTVSQARLLRDRDPVAVTALQLLAAAVTMLPVALATEAPPGRPSSAFPVIATLGLVLAGTVAPTTLFTFAQSKVSADVAGAFLNLEPLVGAAFGVVMFADPLGPAQVTGGAAIVTGIVLSSLQAVRANRQRRAQNIAGSPPPVASVSPEPVIVTAGEGKRGAPIRLAAGEPRIGLAAGGAPNRLAAGEPSIRLAAGEPRIRLAAGEAPIRLAAGEPPSLARRRRWPIEQARAGRLRRPEPRAASRPAARSRPPSIGRMRTRSRLRPAPSAGSRSRARGR